MNSPPIYDHEKVFACYSPNLNKFLQGKKIVAFKQGIHATTRKHYCLYLKDDRLGDALTEWRNTKPSD